MCLAIEGKILEIENKTAKVDFGGIVRDIQLDLTPEAAVGKYVLAHAGFAIQVVDEPWMETLAKEGHDVSMFNNGEAL